MTASEATTAARYAVEIAQDRLRAHLNLNSQDVAALPSRDAIIKLLEDAGIAPDAIAFESIDALLAIEEDVLPQSIVVAEGRPPQDGRDEELVWDPALRPSHEDPDSKQAVDYYTFNSITTVDKDVSIGTISAGEVAQDGVDVFGKPIPPPRQAIRLELDDTVRRDDNDASKIIANIAGRVVCEDGKLTIRELLEVTGDVDFGTGNIDAPTDVRLSGSVNDRFVVKSRGSIFVGGAIEAATVEAEHDVEVGGGILGRERGSVVAGGAIRGKFANEATLRACGDMEFSKELISCRVHTDGRLIVDCGAVIGGQAYAREGIVVKNLGGEAGTVTRVAVGIHPALLKRREEIRRGIQAKLDTIEKIRTAVQPLLDNIKRLSPSQKEQATELMFKADEAELAVKEDERRIEEMLAAGEPKAPAKVCVHDCIRSAVTISIGLLSTTTHKELKGPLAIESRKINNATELVSVNQLSGSVIVMPSVRLPLEQLLEGYGLLDDDRADAVAASDSTVETPVSE